MKTQLRTRKQRGGSNRNMDEAVLAVPHAPNTHLPVAPGPLPINIDIVQTYPIRIPKKRISSIRPRENPRFSIPFIDDIRLVLSERPIQ
jgi:hypothetical protein